MLIGAGNGIDVHVSPYLEVPAGYYDDGPALPWSRWRQVGPRNVVVAPSLWRELLDAIPEARP